MTRRLTSRESDALVFLIDSGIGAVGDPTDADRARWRGLVDRLRVSATCACGTCPSIDLALAAPANKPAPKVSSAGTTPDTAAAATSRRVVLEGFTPGAFLLLFIDDDVPTLLELAPIDDKVFDRFPPVADLSA